MLDIDILIVSSIALYFRLVIQRLLFAFYKFLSGFLRFELLSDAFGIRPVSYSWCSIRKGALISAISYLSCCAGYTVS